MVSSPTVLTVGGRRGREVGVGVKIAVIGGGSTYTPELGEGFVPRADPVAVDELVLLDPDLDRLSIVGGLAERMLLRLDWPGRLVITDDREAAIDGGDFVGLQVCRGRHGGRRVADMV